MVHVFGYLTLVSICIVAAFAARWLWVAGHHTYSWLRALPVPKLVELHSISTAMPDGFSDFVGPV